jgi:hypothetical protein
MKKSIAKENLRAELEKNPNISAACNNVGISRQTYYRWVMSDGSFKLAMESALSLGVEYVNNIAESHVIRGVQNGDKSYVKYWLNNRHQAYKRNDRYANPHIFVVDTLKEEAHLKEIEEYLKINGYPKYFREVIPIRDQEEKGNNKSIT